VTHVYFDESHHERGDFTLGAFVFADSDLGSHVNEAITSAGLTPGVDEYKSRMPHATEAGWIDLRKDLYRLAGGCKIGLLIAPYGDRKRIGEHALLALAYLLRENTIASPVRVFMDQGLFRSKAEMEKLRRDSKLPAHVDLHVECDSRTVGGIQIADLVAHTCSIALLGQMGLIDKMISDEEDGEYSLAFEMWARLRYNFFTKTLTDPDRREEARRGMMDSKSGLYIVPEVNAMVTKVAQQRFGDTWLGCIH
jgi:hypothetical protein